MGGMAFPSASEPNPVAQGIRGQGPETINYAPTPTSAPPQGPAGPTGPSTPPPFTGAELFQSGAMGSNALYSLQGGIGNLIYNNAVNMGANNPILVAFGYSDLSQVPQLPTDLSLYKGTPINYSAATGTGLFQGGGVNLNQPFSYNTSAQPFTSYQPTYNPINIPNFSYTSMGGLSNPFNPYPVASSYNFKPYGT